MRFSIRRLASMIWRPLSWPRSFENSVGLLQQIAQIGLAVASGGVFVGAGDFQGGGQRDGAALHPFDQALFPLVEQQVVHASNPVHYANGKRLS
jgi:hypothetical protein